MISTRHIRKFCYEDPSLIENYDKAIADTAHIWEIHHRVETIMNCGAEELIAKGCYENRPAHDLILLTKTEHRSLHHAGKYVGEATKSKLSQACKGKLKGRPKSAEHCVKIAAALKGKHRSEEVKAKISAAKKGKKMWNNGVKNMYSVECPGDGWVPGFLPRKKKS